MSEAWERLVQTTKKHLKSVAINGLLNDLELRTLLAEIESTVNYRPITTVSDDTADLTALTPNHLLPLSESCTSSSWGICEGR